MEALDQAPLVELDNAFEEDYFVGPPPGASSQSNFESPPVLPYRSPGTRGRPPKYKTYGRFLPESHEDVAGSSDQSNSVNSTEPVMYTPRHPSQIQTHQRPTPIRRTATRRSAASMISDTPADSSIVPGAPPRSKAALQNYRNIMSGQTQPAPTVQAAVRANTLRPNAVRRSVVNNTNHMPAPGILNPNLLLPRPRSIGIPRFQDPPNFTTPNWTPQYSGFPPQAHSSYTTNTNSSVPLLNGPLPIPNAPRQSMNQQVPVNSAFAPRAQPVRPAMFDFLNHIMNTVPGIDALTLLQQLNNDPTKLHIPVPSGMDQNAQSQLQQNLELALSQFMNNTIAPNQQPINQRPQFVNAALLNNPALNNMLNGQAYPPQYQQAQPPAPPPPPPTEDDMARQDKEADAHQDEEFAEVETYSDYMPAKLNIGHPHPDPVVETSSLSTVEPPDVTYKLNLPPNVIERAMLSALQLETVTYASQQHQQMLPDGKHRRGFLIGDGAGVGKGRTIAGIIYENYLCGRKKAIWFSVSTDLKLDAERDLKDIGAKRVPVFLLGKFPYGRRINEDSGIIFTTYSGLVSKSQSVRGSLSSRIGQLVNWAGPKFDGVIVFDECHKAKNISVGKGKQKQSKAAEFALDIQMKLPMARIVYASATGASETRHLGYMTRLGIWGEGTPYSTFNSFCDAIDKRGVGAMELVAVDLKMRGAYMARQLSFKTTNFEIRHAALTDEFTQLYDECVEMWSKAFRHFTEAESYFAADRKRLRVMWTSFWASHQRFFKYLCIGAKVPLVVEIARAALESDKCVVIGLQSTGEARTLEALEEGDISEFVSTARATFESLIDNHFPAPEPPRRRRGPTPTPTPSHSSDSDIDLGPGFKQSPPTSECSLNSSSTEELFNDQPFTFHSKDGKALVEPKKKRKTASSSKKRVVAQNKKSTTTTTTSSCSSGGGGGGGGAQRAGKKNEKVLKELLDLKKGEPKKSTRALRAKRRASARQKVKSRIKLPDDDSDTEISNPMSSCSSENFLKSSTSSSGDGGGDDNNSDSTFSPPDSKASGDDLHDNDGSSTVIESGDEEEDDEIAFVGAKKQNASSDTDDSDEVQITAVKQRRSYDVVILSSDDDGDEEEDDEDADDDGGGGGSGAEKPMVKFGARLLAMREDLYASIDLIGPQLPNNTLDDLIDKLGGSDKVAEMTGRKGRVVKDEAGLISYKQRNEVDALENMNIAEKERFMRGEKLVAIISEAASSGISLQADRRVANKRRRVHVTIELPWSADKAIQQFGRTHRSNQVSGPEYVFVISDLAGEKRFASAVAKRLESLGALTHGDRRANNESRDLSQYNIDSKYSRQALEMIRDVLRERRLMNDIKPDYPLQSFLADARKAFVDIGLARTSKYNDFIMESSAFQMNQFLNRILGMRVRLQNAIFKLFTDYTERIIHHKKIAGKFDAGILELNSESGRTHCLPPEDFQLTTKTGQRVPCSLRQVQVERGHSWQEIGEIFSAREDTDSRSGFYKTKWNHILMLMREPGATADRFILYRPNLGRHPKAVLYGEATYSTSKVEGREAEKLWTHIYETTNTHCIHQALFKHCKRLEAKMKCDVGLRHRMYCILSGSVLTAWPYLEKRIPHATDKIQIVRLRLEGNNRVIGPIIQQEHVDKVRKILKEAERVGVEF